MSDQPHPRYPRVLVVRTKTDGTEIDVAVEPDLLWFQGHFPDMAILPGVVQLDWALAFARHHLGLTSLVARRFQVKYKTVIVPGTHLTLALRRTPDGRRLTFEYRCGSVVCSTGSVTLEAA